MTYPEGISWNGDTVKLVVGIASKGDEHLEILGRIVAIAASDADTDALVAGADPRACSRSSTVWTKFPSGPGACSRPKHSIPPPRSVRGAGLFALVFSPLSPPPERSTSEIPPSDITETLPAAGQILQKIAKDVLAADKSR